MSVLAATLLVGHDSFARRLGTGSNDATLTSVSPQSVDGACKNCRIGERHPSARPTAPESPRALRTRVTETHT